mgnify:CR=1 FL=1
MSKLPKNLKFDIVTAFDVIEHVESPVNFLNMIKKYLKKNGIVLIYTPNKNSLGFNYLKFYNNLLCPPTHLFYFAENSFRYLCKKTNFKLIFHQTRGLDFGDIYAYHNEKPDKKLAKLIFNNSHQLQKIFDELNELPETGPPTIVGGLEKPLEICSSQFIGPASLQETNGACVLDLLFLGWSGFDQGDRFVRSRRSSQPCKRFAKQPIQFGRVRRKEWVDGHDQLLNRCVIRSSKAIQNDLESALQGKLTSYIEIEQIDAQHCGE